jgi:hypothetical protein
MAIHGEPFLEDLRRKDQQFNRMIFWRDAREIIVCLVMVPVWLYLGARSSLPWTWYLMIPAILWIGGFMLVDRLRQQRRTPGLGEPLRDRVKCSLEQLDHQIWLLRNVHWWYLLPIAMPLSAFVVQGAWLERSEGWSVVLVAFMAIALVTVVFGIIYWVNQLAVRANLAPRRRELEGLLVSLADDAPGVR